MKDMRLPTVGVRALTGRRAQSETGAGVIGSAVIPTLIANAFFLPRHLLPQPVGDDEALAIAEFDEESTDRPKQLEPTQSI